MVLETVRAYGGTRGAGAPANTVACEGRFLLACAAGLFLAAAAPALAGDYEEGLSFHQNRNFAQSLPLFRRAAEQGDARAQFSIAYMYAAGQGVAQDYLEAHQWAVAAAASGHEQAKDLRALLEKSMPPEQLAQALARARQTASMPEPARAAATAAMPADTAASSLQAVSAALESWRAAWSRRDAAAYLAAYAPDFKLPEGVARARWEAQRRLRLARAARIEVRIDDPVIRFAPDGSASVRFAQAYASSILRDSSDKTLVFAIYGGNWLIREESSTP
jgi:hypothetical protein